MAAVALGAIVALEAMAYQGLPGDAVNQRTLLAQRKADELFREDAYERALTIYRDELAPLGDKFAQYMVGYMYLAGKGVERDPVTALAWYCLAAERGDDAYRRVRDVLGERLDGVDRERANLACAALAARIGDVVLLRESMQRDLDRLRRHDIRAARVEMQNSLAVRTLVPHDYALLDTLTARLEKQADYLQELAGRDESLSGDELAEVKRLIDEARAAVEEFRAPDQGS